jgi:invasion protein IalB
VHEVVDEDGNVLFSFAQRRQADFDDVEAVIQIVPEAVLLQQGFQFEVGGRDQAEIRLLRAVGTERREDPPSSTRKRSV